MIMNKIWLPNLLTMIRLVVSPLFLPFLIVYLVPFDYQIINFLVCLVFLVFCLTDFFDGYYARKFDNLSKLGSLLDPIADKFLIYAALIALVTIGKVYFFWAIILIGREFLVMGVRLIGSEHQIKVPLIFLAKCKTVLEMAYVGCVILQTSDRPLIYYEYILLCASLVAALISAYQYAQGVYAEFKELRHGDLF